MSERVVEKIVYKDGLSEEKLKEIQDEKGAHAHSNDRAHANCKFAKDQTPRPQSYKACTDGYEGGFRAVQNFANDLKAKHNTPMDAAALEAANKEEEAARAAEVAERAKLAEARRLTAEADAKKASEAAQKGKEEAKQADDLQNARAA